MDPSIDICPVEALMVAIAMPNETPSAVNSTGTFLVTFGLHHLGSVRTVLPFANEVAASLILIELAVKLDGACTVTFVPAHH